MSTVARFVAIVALTLIALIVGELDGQRRAGHAPPAAITARPGTANTLQLLPVGETREQRIERKARELADDTTELRDVITRSLELQRQDSSATVRSPRR